MADTYPLQWPQGWPRTPGHKRTKSRYKVNAQQAAKGLLEAVQRLGAIRDSVVVSTNVRPQSFANHSTVRPIDDPGVAVYWATRTNGERVIACDRWISVYENVHAIELAVEGLRSIERAGASQILERAFSAFGALPASPEEAPRRPWWEVFGFTHAMLEVLSLAVVEARYRELAAKAHPDRTGTEAAMVELNQAREEAKAHYGR